MGVRRAVDMVLDASNSTNGPICTYGPLIHNPQVLEMLRQKGIPSINAIPETGSGIVLIRAHGVPPEDQEALKKAGFQVINATCPRVIRVQTIIRKHAEKGFSTIIIGDRDHPEVRGLMGYAAGQGYTASTLEELEALPPFDQAVIVAQTTQDTSLYSQVKKWAMQHHPTYKIFDTICDSTEKRQHEIRKLAEANDAVIVVGGKESGNTRRLAQIARDSGKNCSHIEDIAELNFKAIESARSIAITAGASTPNWVINKTFRTLEEAFHRKHSSWIAFLMETRGFLLKSNLFISAGAASLTLACTELQGAGNGLSHAIIAMFYILSMQIINNLFSISSDRYNNPGRAAFYEKNKLLLALLAVASGSTGLYLAFMNNLFSFFLLALMSLLGLSYNQRIIPPLISRKRFKRIKDIPGSKTVLIAAAWGTVTSLLPAISHARGWSFIPGFLLSAGLVFARTAFFDILEIQGDRIAGKETLPIAIGEKRSLSLIRHVLIAAGIALLIASATGFTSQAGFFLAILPLSMFYFIFIGIKDDRLAGAGLEFLVESHFIVAGLITAFF